MKERGVKRKHVYRETATTVLALHILTGGRRKGDNRDIELAVIDGLHESKWNTLGVG